MQRKKLEAEERRLRQRKAKEEFTKMLEVSFVVFMYFKQHLDNSFLFTVFNKLFLPLGLLKL